jgi:hypothetical protein
MPEQTRESKDQVVLPEYIAVKVVSRVLQGLAATVLPQCCYGGVAESLLLQYCHSSAATTGVAESLL